MACPAPQSRTDADDIALHAGEWLAAEDELVQQWLAAATQAHVDAGLAPVGLTPDREQLTDFTHPFIETGLQVLVLDGGGGFLGGTLGALLGQLFSWQLLSVVLVLVVALSIAAHVIWWTERDTNPDFPPEYRKGIWEAFWWAAVTATTVGYGDRTPTGTAGRIVTDTSGTLRLAGSPLRLAGSPFPQKRYGFVVPGAEQLRERINLALLELVEDGGYAALHEQWFGNQPLTAGA